MARITAGIAAITLFTSCNEPEIHPPSESSPPEDKQARMAYQMQRLVEGMGSAGALGSKGEQLVEQINSFIAMRPAGDWMDRFSKGVEATRKQP